MNIKIALGIGVLVIVLGAAYWYSQSATVSTPSAANTPDASAVVAQAHPDWKTYTDEKYGFSFMYPPSFTSVKNGGTVAGVVPRQTFVTISTPEETASIDVEITENQSVDVDAKTIQFSHGGPVPTEQVMVGAKKGILFDAGGEGWSGTAVRFPLGKDMVQVDFSSRDDTFYKNRAVIDDILKSFTFAGS